MMNAIELILTHHARIRKFLTRISKFKNPSSLENTFNKLAEFLISHETMEQKVWYPFLKKNSNLKPIIKHLVAEEKLATKNIAKIKKIKSTELFEEKLMELASSVSHHANEEETKLFPKVEKYIEDRDLKMIGKEMREFKNAFDNQGSYEM